MLLLFARDMRRIMTGFTDLSSSKGKRMKLVVLVFGMLLLSSPILADDTADKKNKLPPGSWTTSCDLSKTSIDAFLLSSWCQPYGHPASMDMRYCGLGVENQKGLLVCQGYDTYPRGDFLSAVVKSHNAGSGHLKIAVKRTNSDDVVQNTLVVSYCKSRTFKNVNGIISCVGRNDLGWSFAASCKNIFVNQTKYNIKAECKTKKNTWVSVDYDYTQCLQHDVLNKDGVLTCTKKLWWQD